jgi:hypothetical protein
MKKLCCLSRRSFLPAIILVLFCLPYSAKATVYPFTATYQGSQEVPATGSTATGTITGTYNDSTNTISFSITFSGLGSNATAAHFHGPAFPGISASVTYAHAGFPTGVTSGSLPVTTQVITDAQEKDLLAGKWYSNIHTTNFQGGEIRAQIFFGAPFVAPTIKCPKDTVLSNAANQCSASLTFSADTAGSAPAELNYRIGTTVITSPFNFPVGVSAVTATALNGGGFATCTFNVTVRDTQPPVITCPANISRFNDRGVCGAIVTFTPTATDNCSKVTVTSSPASGSFFPVGVTTVSSTATDSSGNKTTCSFTLTVTDNEPPVISGMGANPSVLWPPNHKWHNVTVNYTSTDNCGVVTCGLTVVSNQPGNGNGDGNTHSDWQIVDDHHIRLRAERSGSSGQRVYTITATCTDQYGNSGNSTTTVRVPHHMIITLKPPHGHTTVHVSPNPTADQFTLHIETTELVEKINVKVIDLSGRILEQRSNLTGDQTLRIGENLKPGIYFIQLQQGGDIKLIKLLKIKQ